MLWIYVLLTTVGVVAIVPTVLRAIDGKPADTVTGIVGFVGLVSGLTGLFCRQVGVDSLATFVAAAALGLAAGALHPELLSMLRRDPTTTAPAMTAKKKTKVTHAED